jgi:hypothetical protein
MKSLWSTFDWSASCSEFYLFIFMLEPENHLHKKIKLDASTTVDSTSFTEFLRWGIEHGARFDKIQFVNLEKEERGGIAVGDINAEEELISVPLEMLLSMEVVLKSSLATLVRSTKVAMKDEWTIFYLFIIHETFCEPLAADSG